MDIPVKEDCIFCKIVKGEIPSSKVYEDEKFVAFLDIHPANLGHCLVIPKGHYETFNQIPSDVLGEFIKIVQKVSLGINKVVNPDGYNILMNNYKAAGQLVNHAHFHIIPRFNDDNVIIKLGEKEFRDISKEIRGNV
jgi:histidine triad (HIT) family protein